MQPANIITTPYGNTEERLSKAENRKTLSRILTEWQNRKLAHGAQGLQDAAGKHNYDTIWKYQRSIKQNRK